MYVLDLFRDLSGDFQLLRTYLSEKRDSREEKRDKNKYFFESILYFSVGLFLYLLLNDATIPSRTQSRILRLLCVNVRQKVISVDEIVSLRRRPSLQNKLTRFIRKVMRLSFC